MPTILRDKPEVEFLNGRAYPKVSPRRSHALVQAAILAIVSRCAGERGDTGPEWRCRLTPQTEFVPDVAYFSFERLRPLSEAEREEPPFAPDIAVEVRSPSHRARYDAEKIAVYLAHGSLLVLDIDPATRMVYAHAPNSTTRIYHATEAFAHASAPWLRFDVADLFTRLKLPEL
ncbi:MAG: Uma2 family endonuclease [Vulcanimicrobiaceae bacterium]